MSWTSYNNVEATCRYDPHTLFNGGRYGSVFKVGILIEVLNLV